MKKTFFNKLIHGIILFVIILSLCACESKYPARDISDIESFLKAQDIYTAGTPACKDIHIPEEFSDVYENYNELQKQQGFDLSDYRSRDAVMYTFDAVSIRGEHVENTQVHIIVYNESIIGGDAASAAIDGGMVPIIAGRG